MSWFKIFSAVLVANIVSWVIVTVVGWLLFFVVLDTFSTEFKNSMSSSPVIERQQRSVIPDPSQQGSQHILQNQKQREQELAERRKAERQEKQWQAAIQGAKENCDFWTQQYRKDNDPESEAYKEMACSRYENYRRNL